MLRLFDIYKRVQLNIFGRKGRLVGSIWKVIQFKYERFIIIMFKYEGFLSILIFYRYQ